MEWVKIKTPHRGDPLKGGKMHNSAVYQAKAGNFTFTAHSNRKGRHGGWVLSSFDTRKPFPCSVICKSLSEAKARAEHEIAQAT